MDLSIVIVTSNTRELLRNCLKSIFETTSGIEYEVIVVDNNSTDGSVDMMERTFPFVKLICNDRNLGFSKGSNQGFAVSSGRYVLTLNSDTVVSTHAIALTVRLMDEHPEAGAVGCRIVNRDGIVQLTYERFPTLLSELFYTTPLRRLFPHNVAEDRGAYLEVDWVQGSFLMLRRSALEQVGMFDEVYSPAYSEETDLCYRLKKAGWHIYYVPDATIVHFGGQTTKFKDTWYFLQLHRSKFHFFKKHRGIIYAHTYRCLRWVACLIRIGTLVAKLSLNTGKNCHLRKKLRLQWHLFRFLLDPQLRVPDIS